MGRESEVLSVTLLVLLTMPKYQLTSSERDGSDAVGASRCRLQGTRLRRKAFGSRMKATFIEYHFQKLRSKKSL